MTYKEMAEKLNRLEKEVERLQALEVQNEEYRKEIERLNEIIRNMQRRHFKASSEKSALFLQESLFNEPETIADQDPESPEEETIVKEHVRRKKGAGIKDSNIRTEIIEHDLEDKRCPECGHMMKETEPTVVERLVYNPSEWVLERHIIRNYECSECSTEEGNVLKVPACKVPQLIEGSMVTPSVFGHIFTEKYVKAVPIYRTEAVLNREGIYLSRQLMSSWFLQIMEIYISILISLMREDLKKEDILYGDETTVKCLEEQEHENNYMWLQCTGPYAEKQIYLYSYHDGRDGEFCAKLYEGYEGYLHCDAYSTYKGMAGVNVVACWDHVRRRIVDAVGGDQVKEEYDKYRTKEKRAGFLASHKGFALKVEYLELVDELYRLERSYKKKKLNVEEIKRERNIQSRKQLDKIREFLDANLNTFAESSKMYEAIHYADNNWEGLSRYIEDGRLEINNSRSERAIKDFVIGRKNWLFNNTRRGAQASADAYSLAVTIKANNLNPQKYIEYVLDQMIQMDKADPDQYRELLPYSESLPEYMRINRKKSKSDTSRKK